MQTGVKWHTVSALLFTPQSYLNSQVQTALTVTVCQVHSPVNFQTIPTLTTVIRHWITSLLLAHGTVYWQTHSMHRLSAVTDTYFSHFLSAITNTHSRHVLSTVTKYSRSAHFVCSDKHTLHTFCLQWQTLATYFVCCNNHIFHTFCLQW